MSIMLHQTNKREPTKENKKKKKKKEE